MHIVFGGGRVGEFSLRSISLFNLSMSVRNEKLFVRNIFQLTETGEMIPFEALFLAGKAFLGLAQYLLGKKVCSRNPKM